VSAELDRLIVDIDQ